LAVMLIILLKLLLKWSHHNCFLNSSFISEMAIVSFQSYYLIFLEEGVYENGELCVNEGSHLHRNSPCFGTPLCAARHQAAVLTLHGHACLNF